MGTASATAGSWRGWRHDEHASGDERIAEAGIPEYWIVDPRDETITVLALDGDACRDIGVFGRGDAAKSRVLDGFAADVRAVFDAPKPDA